MLSEGLSDVRRGSFNSLVVVASLAVAVSVLGFYYYSRLNLQHASVKLLNQFQIEAFVSLAYPEDQHGALREKLQALNPRWQIAYVSRQQAAERFSQEFDPSIFSILQENPFPASFIITLPLPNLAPDSVGRMVELIDSIEPIDEVIFDAELLNLVHQTRRRLSEWGGVLGGLAVLLAIALTYNAMRLKIDQQRSALYLMSLMGATTGMLRGIYWMQGILLGAAGGVLAAGVLQMVKFLFQVRWLGDLQLVLPQLWLTILVGAGLGWLGGLVAVGRGLKV